GRWPRFPPRGRSPSEPFRVDEPPKPEQTSPKLNSTTMHNPGSPTWSRRKFIGASAALLAAPRLCTTGAARPDPIIDIHQHTHYHGRSDEDLIRHQRIMGATL